MPHENNPSLPQSEEAPKAYRMSWKEWDDHSRKLPELLAENLPTEALGPTIAQQFRAYYPDENEAFAKFERFVQALHFYIQHKEALEGKNLVVIGSENSGDLLLPELVKGLYNWFGLVPIREPFPAPSLEQILELTKAHAKK